MSLQIPGFAYRAEDGIEVPDAWSQPILLPHLDDVFIYNDLTPGYQAYLQWGDEFGHEFGPQVLVRVGVNSWSERGRYGYGSFRLRAATAGNNPVIDYEAHGLPRGGWR